MSSEPTAETTEAPVEGAPPLWKRPLLAVRRFPAWVAAHRLKAILSLAIVAVLAVVPVAVLLTTLFARAKPPSPDAFLAQAWEAFDQKRLEDAEAWAVTVIDDPAASAELRAQAWFIRGASQAAQAHEATLANKIPLYRQAALWLIESRTLGFPPSKEAQAVYLLAVSLHHSQQWLSSVPVLQKAIQASPEHRAELLLMRAEALLNQPNPNLDEAFRDNAAALADGGLKAGSRPIALLQRLRILLDQGKISEARGELAKLPEPVARSPDGRLLRARLVLADVRSPKSTAVTATPPKAPHYGAYQEPIDLLRQAQAGDVQDGQVTRKAAYLVGVCLLEAGDLRAALHQFTRVRTLFSGSGEAMAAAVQSAELLRREGRHSEAMVACREVLTAIPRAETYSNPWISLDQLRARVLKIYQDYAEQRDYSQCASLVEHLATVLPEERLTELAAENSRAWGRSQLEQAAKLPPAQAEPLRREARRNLRAAGRYYQRLAQLLLANARYPDELWNSIQAYLEGHGYREAASLLEDYLHHEPQRRRADALVALGEVRLTLGQLDAAMTVFAQCLERYPREAATFRGRLIVSRAALEKGDLASAERHLVANLQAELLTPRSTEWRESLFDLGRVLHLAQRYEEAVVRLDEAIRRYPDSPRSLESRYMLADSYRQIAGRLSRGLKDVLVESTRIVRARQAQQAYRKALDGFASLRADLSQRPEGAEWTAHEKCILRNSYFGVAESYFALGEYDEAVKAYLMTIARNATAAESLEAYRQVAYAYQRMDKQAEARGAWEQARLLLARVPNTANFQETTNDSRKQWEATLVRQNGGG